MILHKHTIEHHSQIRKSCYKSDASGGGVEELINQPLDNDCIFHDLSVSWKYEAAGIWYDVRILVAGYEETEKLKPSSFIKICDQMPKQGEYNDSCVGLQQIIESLLPKGCIRSERVLREYFLNQG